MRYASMHTDQNLGFAWGALIGVATSVFSASKQRKARKATQREAARQQQREIAAAQRREQVSVRANYPPQWLNPALIIGGVVAVGAVVYFSTRRRRRR